MHGNGQNMNNTDVENVVLCGRNAVLEALRADTPIDTIYICGSRHGDIIRLAKEKGIVVKDADEKKLAKIAGEENKRGTQDICATGAFVTYLTLDELLERRDSEKPPLYIICDEIEDPHNLGAIIRTAEGAGADGIIIPKRRSASVSAAVFRTSAGAASWLPIARVTNIAAAIDKLKENGIWIYGSDADGIEYTKTDFRGASAIVIGSEGFGMGRLIREKCDVTVSLPMLGKITSLNASVAAGILMYEVVRQRRAD